MFTSSYSEAKAKYSRSPSIIIFLTTYVLLFSKYDFIIFLYVFSVAYKWHWHEITAVIRKHEAIVGDAQCVIVGQDAAEKSINQFLKGSQYNRENC